MTTILLFALWVSAPSAPAQVERPDRGRIVSSGTPIVVPFGTSPEVTLTAPSMPFDLDGDGTLESISWPINGGFLVQDRDGDGQITSGRELYGDATFPDVANGFDAILHEMKQDPNWPDTATLDATIPLYHRVKVWADENQNGITDPGELEPLSDYITTLFLFYKEIGKKDPYGNTYRLMGNAVFADGEQRPIYDVFLVTQ